MTRPSSRAFALTVLAVVICATFIFVYTGYFDWQSLPYYRDVWRDWIAAHPLLGAGIYFAAYVFIASLSIPGATAMTLLGGSLFGVAVGTALVSFASAVGATIAMLTARYLARGFVEARFSNTMVKINAGMKRNGGAYLFGLRLVPVVPFFVVNLAMGLTRIGAWTFFWISQIGMFPTTVVYVSAGSQLATIERASDILDWRFILSLLGLGFAFLAIRIAYAAWENRRRYARFSRPARIDYNLVVIGAGSAGLVAAYGAAIAGARVALVEKYKMGGDCLNTGCIPSKALIRSAKLAHESKNAASFGMEGALRPDFAAIMARIRRVIGRIEPHDSAARYEGLGVEVIKGEAYVKDPWTVAVGARTLTTRNIVIATGAEPMLPPIAGLAAAEPLTSETAWSLKEQPGRLVVLGGGAIGCEIAQSFARLGTMTTIIEAAPRLLAREDEDVSAFMRSALEDEGLDLRLAARVVKFESGDGERRVVLEDGQIINFDAILVATGRKPRVAGFGLEELGLLEDGKFEVDERLRTRLPNIYAAGDVLGQLQFTHAAGRHGWLAAINALFSPFVGSSSDMRVFPAVTYTDPEVARVGLNESEARAAHRKYDVTRYDLGELDRAITDEAPHGYIKILTVPRSDKIIGVTIVGSRAGDMLSEFTLAMSQNVGLKAIMNAIHPYPGWADANKLAAGQWRKANAPQWALALSRRFMAWRRS